MAEIDPGEMVIRTDDDAIIITHANGVTFLLRDATQGIPDMNDLQATLVIARLRWWADKIEELRMPGYRLTEQPTREARNPD